MTWLQQQLKTITATNQQQQEQLQVLVNLVSNCTYCKHHTIVGATYVANQYTKPLVKCNLTNTLVTETCNNWMPNEQ